MHEEAKDLIPGRKIGCVYQCLVEIGTPKSYRRMVSREKLINRYEATEAHAFTY